MAEQFKDIFFTPSTVAKFAEAVKKAFPGFEKTKFINMVFDEEFATKELLAKMHHTTFCLFETLPKSYPKALEVLKKAAPYVKGFEALTLPDYVAIYGMKDWKLSLSALFHFTQYSTSELAIRPFLDKDPETVMEYMKTWAEHENPMVRRLASEGCRPRLPWAMALPKFKKDPSPILPILEKLKDDPSEDVRRSVANNLNDISKDHPDTALDICERWHGKSDKTDKIVKHACRTLLKAGNRRALSIFGYSDPAKIDVKNLRLEKNELKIGDVQSFSFSFHIKEKSKVRLEYAAYYVKSKGQLSKKVFKITERDYKPGTHTIKRKHSFENMSTRKHFPGVHYISLIMNGEEKGKMSFELID